jgi:hypothetical protein
MARPRKNTPRLEWPTLDEQLVVGKVVRDTPLHQFILENQDFSLLRPEEATDGIGLPPWIRVYWRRLHPEAEFSADDPTGGYPLSLKEVYHAMLRDQEWPARVPRPETGKSSEASHGE